MENYDPYSVREMLSRERPDLCDNNNAVWLSQLLTEAMEKGFRQGWDAHLKEVVDRGRY